YLPSLPTRRSSDLFVFITLDNPGIALQDDTQRVSVLVIGDLHDIISSISQPCWSDRPSQSVRAIPRYQRRLESSIVYSPFQLSIATHRAPGGPYTVARD